MVRGSAREKSHNPSDAAFGMRNKLNGAQRTMPRNKLRRSRGLAPARAIFAILNWAAYRFTPSTGPR